VRSGGGSPRSHRREERAGRLAPARERLCAAPLHAPSVAAVWFPGLAGPAIPADPARLGASRPGGAAGARGHVGAARLYAVPHGLAGGPLHSRPTWESVDPARAGSGGPARGRGRLALPSGAVAPRARPSRLGARCDPSDLGRRGGGKKAQGRRAPDVLAWAWAALAGAGAADARSAGPCGLLSAIENRRSRRLLAEGLAQAPEPADMRACLGRLQTALGARGGTRRGLTTDGAARSPAPLREVGGTVRHHSCPCPRGAAVSTAG